MYSSCDDARWISLMISILWRFTLTMDARPTWSHEGILMLTSLCQDEMVQNSASTIYCRPFSSSRKHGKQVFIYQLFVTFVHNYTYLKVSNLAFGGTNVLDNIYGWPCWRNSDDLFPNFVLERVSHRQSITRHFETFKHFFALKSRNQFLSAAETLPRRAPWLRENTCNGNVQTSSLLRIHHKQGYPVMSFQKKTGVQANLERLFSVCLFPMSLAQGQAPKWKQPRET